MLSSFSFMKHDENIPSINSTESMIGDNLFQAEGDESTAFYTAFNVNKQTEKRARSQ